MLRFPLKMTPPVFALGLLIFLTVLATPARSAEYCLARISTIEVRRDGVVIYATPNVVAGLNFGSHTYGGYFLPKTAENYAQYYAAALYALSSRAYLYLIGGGPNPANAPGGEIYWLNVYDANFEFYPGNQSR